jgi:hypothetical protein
MPSFSYNFAGYGVINATSIVTSGDIEAQGQFLAKNGTATSPGFAFKESPTYGLFNEPAGSRLAVSAGNSEAAYWGNASNHVYKHTSFASTTTFDGDLTMQAGRAVCLDASTSTSDCPLQKTGDPNTGLTFPGADQMNAIVGGVARFQLGGATADVLMTGTNKVTYLMFGEVGAPSNPPADHAYVYAVVDGGTLTDLAAKFQDGTVAIFAQEV